MGRRFGGFGKLSVGAQNAGARGGDGRARDLKNGLSAPDNDSSPGDTLLKKIDFPEVSVIDRESFWDLLLSDQYYS